MSVDTNLRHAPILRLGGARQAGVSEFGLYQRQRRATIPRLYRMQESRHQALARLGRRRGTRVGFPDPLAGAVHDLPAGGLRLAERPGDVGIVVVEDVMQQERSPFLPAEA